MQSELIKLLPITLIKMAPIEFFKMGPTEFNLISSLISLSFIFRTKWKRQTAVGIELLTEAGNVAALQQMYRGLGYSWPINHPSFPPSLSPLSTLDMYYRQAAAAHSLQRPFPYKLLPGGGGTPLHPSPHPSLFVPSPLLHHSHLSSHLPPLSLPAASTALQEMTSERSHSPPSSPRSPCPYPSSSPPLSLVTSSSPTRQISPEPR